MVDPVIEAAQGILDESLSAMRGAVVDATIDELEWRPAGEDTNTIAILVVHGMHSTRWWLSVASGAPMPDRDRPSEFRATVTTPEELLSFFDQIAWTAGACSKWKAPSTQVHRGRLPAATS